MAVRSRASLHVNDTPPSKRPRLHAPVSRRRKSSPDLLDTTIDDSPAKPVAPLRPSTRRPGPLSSSSFNAASSSALPPPSSSLTPRSKDRIRRHETPTLLLHGSRESPDPLDTISPCTGPNRFLPSRPVSVRPAASAPVATTRRRRFSKTIRPTVDPFSASVTSSPHLPDPSGPASVVSGQQRRSLRSQDGGSRARSELALYFPNYEQLLSLEPPKTEFLACHTRIKLINDLPEPSLSPSTVADPYTDTPFGNPLIHLHGCETIDLPNPTASIEPSEEEDPLNEAAYFRAHRRHERQEKQLRNIERERAQHEKQQLDRLLDELQGQDWLRVMGIGGLTDQEKKQYEPKRDYFVKEISALIQKFKIWKVEEKRRKVEKDKLRVESAEDQNPTPQHPLSSAASHKRRSAEAVEDSDEADESPAALLSDAPSNGELPDDNDVDAWAARQLHHEARSATAGKRPKAPSSAAAEGRRKSKTGSVTELAARSPSPHPIENKPFVSFYSKRHERDNALSTHRKGRVRVAFGHAVPEMQEKEFELPSDILTPEAVDSSRRKRRRMKRASKIG
ncbi:hypothetical protein EYZ11_010375 [Aspergillus tanneri]|uniref:Something about silencing protein 4 domain-containing protein n=1 Tax=Aspergillus tanneri TaxID=1220188 RepID=A0A4S3J5U0_9EURO|nr:uncharacterized protein ATNIH1004_011242 [Aspergillus tanneri]KAA8642300.1 hypothetical protein ATNIH1004_011242 [Aspergillus tanneri]THC90165.1 hypothetical protein EYZ11_010375 [Aspergillus tanneri]